MAEDRRHNIPPEFNGGKKRYASDNEIIAALMRSKGHIARAAKALGYKANSLRQIISRSPLLKEAKNSIREDSVDDAESKLQEHIYDKESLQALLEYLKAAGKARGYGSQSIDMNLDAKVEHSVEDVLLQGLLGKFEAKLKEEVEDDTK